MNDERELKAPHSTPEPIINTVAAVIQNRQGDVLLVRKRGSDTFIQPGGKPDQDEEPLVALARELQEELNISMRVDTAYFLGEFEERAVNEPGRRVRGKAYYVEVLGEPSVQAEIEEMRWFNPQNIAHADVRVAPLSAKHILPAFLQYRQSSVFEK